MKQGRFLAIGVILAALLLALAGAAYADPAGPTDNGPAPVPAVSPPPPAPANPAAVAPGTPSNTDDLSRSALGPDNPPPSSGGFQLPAPPVPSAPSGGCGTPASGYSGAITGASPTEAGRLFRDGVPSTCDLAKSASLFDATARHYQAFWYQNTADQCYTVNVVQSCPEGPSRIFFSTYLDTFNPANPTQYYLADQGSSVSGPYSFFVPAGHKFAVMATETDSGLGCSGFTFTIGHCSCWRSTINGALTAATPAQTNRLLRDGNPSTCGVNKAYPGPWTASNIHYRVYNFSNATANSTCYSVAASAPGCTNVENMIFVSAYTGAYNPADLTANYKADGGASPAPENRFAFNVAAGQAFKVVVTSVTADDGAGTNGQCPAYALNVSRCNAQVCLPAVNR